MIAFSTEVIDVSIGLVLFAWIGTIIRLLLETWLQSPSFLSYMYPHLVGCFLIGFLSRISRPGTLWNVILTTGLCGAITSYSGWIMVAEQNIWLQPKQFSSYVIWLHHAVAGTAFGLASYDLGKQVNVTVKDWQRPSLIWRAISFVSVIVVIGISVWMCATNTSAHIGYTLLFAPIGNLIRYHLGQLLSKPRGTLTANVLAVVILTLCTSLISQCSLRYGLIKGFCGCLSTVSTWIHECKSMSFKSSFLYSLGMWLLCSLLSVSIYLLIQSVGNYAVTCTINFI